MTMTKPPSSQSHAALIDSLVDGLAPVAPLRPTAGLLIAAGVVALSILLVAGLTGLRDDVLAGDPHIMVVQRTIILAMLGCCAVYAAVESVRPRVGDRSNSWALALAIASAFPVLTIASSLRSLSLPMDDIASSYALWCMGVSLSCAIMIGSALTLWARRGAVTTANRTAWLIGLAAGAFGTMAYSLHCPSTTFTYVGIWYTAAIGASAVAARLIIPPLLRW